MYVCMHACMHVCMHVCNVCNYVIPCMCIHIFSVMYISYRIVFKGHQASCTFPKTAAVVALLCVGSCVSRHRSTGYQLPQLELLNRFGETRV